MYTHVSKEILAESDYLSVVKAGHQNRQIIWYARYTHIIPHTNSLNVCLDVQVDEIQISHVLLREGSQWDDSLLDGMTHTLPHRLHLGLMLTNGF